MDAKFGYIERKIMTDGENMLSIVSGNQSNPTIQDYYEPTWLTELDEKIKFLEFTVKKLQESK